VEEQPAAMPQTASENVPSEHGWLAGIGGILLLIILLGPIFGLLLWWLWTKSPLRAWVQILASLAVVILLIIIL
jgi:hypothetical protein